MRLGPLELDVDVGGGEAPVALIGPNGSGKTTLLRTLAGALQPESGFIEIGGVRMFDAAAGVDVAPEMRRVGYVPQGYGLFPHLTALDNVAFAWIARGESLQQRRQAGLHAMQEMGCAHLAVRPASKLSGGEQQRVALARALLSEPRLLLLDEPLAALDAPARRALRLHLAAHLAEKSRPSLVVSHEARDVFALGAEVHVLEQGRIVQSGRPDALAKAPATEFVAAFFEA